MGLKEQSMWERTLTTRILAALLLGWAVSVAAQQDPGGRGGQKSTPAYRETGEPEGDAFHFQPLPVDPRARALGDPMLDTLVRRIETGEANLIERRAWDWLYPRLFPFENPIPSNWRLQTQQRIQLMESTQREAALAAGQPESFVANVWSPVGPATYADSPDVNAGRATALWSDPANKNNILLGTADGGVWKTTDQGTTWYPILDTAASLSIGSIAVDPTNKKVIYVGTGEGNSNGDMINGVGMYKSTDGGTTWTLLPLPAWTYSTFWHSIRRIAVDPLDSTKVYAAIDGGLIYSTNAGASWTKTTCGASGGTYIGSDLVLDPVNGSAGQSIIYVAFGYPGAVADNGIYRSTTGGGGTWTKISSGGGFPSSSVGRISLASAPSDPLQLYALVQSTATSGSLGIFYTGTANAVSVTWSAKSTTNFCSAQCWYDMTGVVHPTTPANFIVGGLDDYLSTDSAANLTQVSQWNSSGTVYSHADHHHLVMGDATTLYDANDGGFFIGTVNWSTKAVTWVNKNAGLRTLQFYGFAQHPTDATKVMGGLQDNGQAYYNGTTWAQVAGGDGGKSAWDQSSSNYGYEEYVYAIIYRNSTMTTSPTSWGTCIRNFGGCTTPLTRCSGNCVPDSATGFIAPFTLDANNQNIMYTGSKYLYVNSAARSGNSWSQPSTTDLSVGGSGDYVTYVHSAKNNGTSGTLYVGTSNGKAWVSPDSGTTMNNITTGLAAASITCFTTDPTNGQKVLVTLSGFGTNHVYRSSNGGATWTDITGVLPAQPFNCVALNPSDANHAYAGSDFGIFENTAVWTGNTWTSITGNLPAVSVQEIGFNVSTGKVRVATHGRGIWELGTVSTASYPQEASPSHNMTAARGSGTTVNLTFTNACGATDNTVYWGDLGTLATSGIAWSGRSCNEGTTGTCTFDPGAGNAYFVIVGNNVVGMEGSYGKTSSNVERPSAGPGSPCAYTQVINGTCP
jgi:hypothetical protein